MDLTSINFASLGSQVKFADTMKYHPSSLGSLTSTLDNVKKNAHRKTHPLVSESTWLFLANLAAFVF